jgi:hypothetical protein
MLQNLPAKISAYLPDAQKSEVQTWWDELATEEQNEIVKSYVLERLHRQTPETLRFYAKFVEGMEKPNQNEFWAVELFEYFVNQERVIDIFEVSYHRGGVCAIEKDAQKAIRKGIIPANFVCPLGKTDCLMTKLTRLGAGKDIRLYIDMEEL